MSNVFAGIDAQKAYDKFLPMALALPADQVRPYSVIPDVAIHNIGKAMPALFAQKDAFDLEFKTIKFEPLLALPELAMGLKSAALDADRVAPEQKPMSLMLEQGWQLRGVLLTTAKALAKSNLVPQDWVDKIAEGKGKKDMANDCIELAKLFRKHEATIAGKHAVTKEQIDQAGEVGTWLSGNMRSRYSTKDNAPPPPPAPEVDIRNRFGTLVVDRYDLLERTMHLFYGPGYQELVPPLMSRTIVRKAEEAASPEEGETKPAEAKAVPAPAEAKPVPAPVDGKAVPKPADAQTASASPG